MNDPGFSPYSVMDLMKKGQKRRNYAIKESVELQAPPTDSSLAQLDINGEVKDNNTEVNNDNDNVDIYCLSPQYVEREPAVNRSPYTTILSKNLDSNVIPLTSGYENASPRFKEVKAVGVNISHSITKVLLCTLVLSVVICLAMCVCLALALYELHQLRSEISPVRKLSCFMCNLSEIVDEFDQNVEKLDQTGKSLTDRISQCFSAQCEASLEVFNASVNIFQSGYASQKLLINILNDPNQLFTTSCASILQSTPSSPSGYYWFRSPNGSTVSMYCDMTLSCGGIGGWTRVVKLDMQECDVECPENLVQRIYSNSIVACGIPTSQYNPICSSTAFSLDNNMQYSKVCGRIRAYSIGFPDAFRVATSVVTINNNYVDGVSLTYGRHMSRRHIWTFAAAVGGSTSCPCTNLTLNHPPAFVGEDYFCDAADPTSRNGTIYSDPLWDDCDNAGTCCSNNSSLPWFYKELPQPTTDNIEMRVCSDETRFFEDVAIEAVEIYVQ